MLNERVATLTTLLVILFLSTKESLAQPCISPRRELYWCYSCIDIDANQTWCRGGNNLLTGQEKIRSLDTIQRLLSGPTYGVQNCGKWSPHCYIMEIFDAGDGKKSRYERGCTNGHDFTVTYLDGSRFTLNVTGSRVSRYLPIDGQCHANNRTVCQFSAPSNRQVCLTVCSEDFCNGPQLPGEDMTEGSGSNVHDGGRCPLLLVGLLTLWFVMN